MYVAVVSMNASPRGGYDCRSDGEVGVAVAGLARALRACGHRVTVFGRTGEDDVVEAGLPDGGSVVGLPAGPVGAFAEQLAESWAADRPAVVHAFDAMSCRVALAAARAAAIPVVATLAGLGTRGPIPPDDLPAALVRESARIVALSSSHVFALMTLGVKPHDVRFVPCGIDTAGFVRATRADDLGERRFRVATLGAIGRTSGVADVIEALSLLGGVDLVVGGGPPPGEALPTDPAIALLAERARARGVADRVRFAGAVGFEAIPAFLADVDVAIAVPHHDALGTVALSAMAAGVPVIASSVGAHIDIVADGMTGIHVPPASPRAIADAIRALAGDTARGERYGRFGAERVRVRYDWARIAPELLGVYAGVQRRADRLTRV